VLNATKPAPIGTDWEGSAMAADLPWKALAPHLPDRLSAGHFLSVCATIVGGYDDRNDEDFLVVEPQPGGWGGSPGRTARTSSSVRATGTPSRCPWR